MTDSKSVTIYMTEDENGILDAISKRLNISKSAVVRNLLIYQGLCGGDMPLTTRILALPKEIKAKALSMIRKRAEANDPEIPQKWREMVRECFGSADAAAQATGAEMLLKRLLSE